MGADEPPSLGIVAQVSPAQNGAEEPQPVRVSAAELHDDVKGLVLVKEPLLWREGPAAELHLRGGLGLQVAVPVGLWAPAGTDDGLSDRLVVARDHGDRLVRLAALAAQVGEG